MTPGTVHVVGAGLAGLSTALELAARGVRAQLWEAAGQAGGRCRSLWDARLGRQIDNGNHLVLSGNRSVARYLGLCGGALQPGAAEFPFVDLGSGARWVLRPNRGPLPWWIAAPGRRVAGTRARDYLAGAALALAPQGRTVAEAIRGRGAAWVRFWEPLTWAALNTTPDHAQARLVWAVFAETFARGAGHCRPMFAPHGLGAALVEPAVARLGPITWNSPLKALAMTGGRVTGLQFADREVALGPQDRVVLALPPSRLRALLPDLALPEDRSAILNAHFVVDDPALASAPPLLGVIGGQTHWIFTRGDVVSLTISAADRLGVLEGDREALTATLWAETARALGLSRPALAARIIVEKRATFDQSPAGVALRPAARTPLANLFLAGDATQTGLPATIEGAIRSGATAAALASQPLP